MSYQSRHGGHMPVSDITRADAISNAVEHLARLVIDGTTYPSQRLILAMRTLAEMDEQRYGCRFYWDELLLKVSENKYASDSAYRMFGGE